jgi:hypothetical protein
MFGGHFGQGWNAWRGVGGYRTIWYRSGMCYGLMTTAYPSGSEWSNRHWSFTPRKCKCHYNELGWGACSDAAPQPPACASASPHSASGLKLHRPHKSPCGGALPRVTQSQPRPEWREAWGLEARNTSQKERKGDKTTLDSVVPWVRLCSECLARWISCETRLPLCDELQRTSLLLQVTTSLPSY